MKSTGLSRLKIVAGLILLHLVISLVFYFIVIPVIAPEGMQVAPTVLRSMQFNYTAIAFVVATVSSIAIVLGLLYVVEKDGSLVEAADALKQPFILLDSNGRYDIINREAERVLGLSRERDIGKSPEPAIQNALASGKSGMGSDLSGSIIERGGVSYQLLDNPLPVHDAAMGQPRIILFRDVSMQMRIRETVRDINQTMVVLNANTMKIASSSSTLTRGATQQAGSLQEISTSLDEFSKRIQGNTETAAKGTQLAAQAREAAERSGNEIAHALTAMTDVQDAGIRIARIVKLIDDIAFQTNLLALNAAVEAARAGRQGKGFAVVADEVRNLAGRSAKAAKDTALMVEDVTERIGNASAYISKLEEMLRNIVQDAIRMADSSESASSTSSDQASAILQVNQELNQMTSMTQNTTTAAEQTATAVEVLVRQVETLKRKLDGLAEEFSSGGSASPASAGTRQAINLLDTPSEGDYRSTPGGTTYAAPASRSVYGFQKQDTSDGDFEAPFRKMAANSWDLKAEADSDDGTSLSSLLRSDGYEDNYQDFLNNAAKSEDLFGSGAGSLKSGKTEFNTTPDGDKVIKPGQSIHLDDSEFGRY